MKVKYFPIALMLMVMVVPSQIGCKKDTAPSAPLIFIDPADLYVYAEVSDVVSFNITVSSEAGLTSFRVESKLDDGQSFTQTDYEEVLANVSSYNKLYEMLVPQSVAGESLILTFTATDANGQQTTALKRLWVQELPVGPVFLDETAGHVMYNSNSQHPNAYNIELGLPVISAFSTDSTERDIQDYPLDTSTTILSRTWISPAGGMFVKFNSFDYANATDSSAAQAFHAGIPLPQVDNLQELDIILLQLEDSIPQIAIIQIMGINNIDTTTSQDSYVFNIKK
jgi:hypothetical protein